MNRKLAVGLLLLAGSLCNTGFACTLSDQYLSQYAEAATAYIRAMNARPGVIGSAHVPSFEDSRREATNVLAQRRHDLQADLRARKIPESEQRAREAQRAGDNYVYWMYKKDALFNAVMLSSCGHAVPHIEPASAVARPDQSTQRRDQQSGQQSGQQSNQNFSERDVSRGQSETAQKSQAEAEKRRGGQRRRHEPEAEAHNCISLDRSQALYGGFVNSCNFKVEYTWCAYRPKKGSWAETTTSCEEGRFGSWSVGPGNRAAGHTKNAEMIYWFACKSPAWALDVEFAGSGVKGRCQTVGGK